MEEKTAKPNKYFAPEVIQTSEMDCGPASLKCILESYGIHANYGRLREACQTSVDGTSIDDIEDLANQLGLDVEQVMLPLDHLLLDDSAPLPCLLVTVDPKGMTHFLVVYNQYFGFVQVMDPGVGRRWMKKQDLLDQVYVHTYPLQVEDWAEWAKSEGFTDPLAARMGKLGIEKSTVLSMIEAATSDPTWLTIASLDAAVRMTDTFVSIKALEKGAECAELVSKLVISVGRQTEGYQIPQAYWSVYPDDQPESQALMMRGAVLLKVNGRRTNEVPVDEQVILAADDQPATDADTAGSSETIARIKVEEPDDVETQVLHELKKDGWLFPVIVATGFIISSVGFSVQAIVLQSLFRFPLVFRTIQDKTNAVIVLFMFLLLLFLFELPLNFAANSIGRKLEARMRIIFLRKLPRLGDRYFHSRLPSDMSSRANGLKSIGDLPMVAIRFVLAVFKMLFTMAGIIWMDPKLFWIAIIATGVFILNGFVSRPIIEEADMRVRTHEGALSRFYLDALRGILPLRTHSAERAFRREFENLLTEWVRASFSINRIGLILQGITAMLYAFFSIWVGLNYSDTVGVAGGGLLLFYWTLNLPSLANEVISFFQSYPQIRNNIRRVLEPLNAPEEYSLNERSSETDAPTPAGKRKPKAVSIKLSNAKVEFSGKSVLRDIDLNIKPGEHIAIIGESGAGKSSLLGLLLGWHQVVEGDCLVDGKPLVGEYISEVRGFTAWVDPEIALWNKTLFQNINYGSETIENPDLSRLFEMANLYPIIERLGQGAQTVIGESGGLISGGEGQRVRLARAFQKPAPRLVILDEPFRGMDRKQRSELMQRAREHWKNSTLLCITHDVSETLNFSRVLVVAQGTIVEDGDPKELANNKTSRFSHFLGLEKKVAEAIWNNPSWVQWNIEDGKVAISQAVKMAEKGRPRGTNTRK